jgi:hypothetical protein
MNSSAWYGLLTLVAIMLPLALAWAVLAWSDKVRKRRRHKT